MVDIVGGSALLQYHLELGRSGMEDSPLSALSIPERRERLRAYNDAWKQLRWSACVELPIADERSFKMGVAPGGILTFVSKRDPKIIFVQIPSNLRGISMRQWELPLSFVPHQYALDPSEDILVVFEWAQNHHGRPCFHFLSLTTGEPHPLAAIPLLFKSRHPLRSLDLKSSQLSITQHYLAILDPMYEVCVYNWKTGQTVLTISSDAIQSVSFLPENRLLLATTRVGDLAKDAIQKGFGNRPALVVYDLDQAPASQHQGVSSPIAVFVLKLVDRDVSTLLDHCFDKLDDEFDPAAGEMKLYHCPNMHSYSDDVSVPFFSLPSDQLIALRIIGFHDRRQLGFEDDNLALPRILLIPIVNLTSHMDGVAADDVPMCCIPWNDWGATGTRWVPDPYRWDFLRGSLSVSGSRFVFVPSPQTGDFVDVWDFSRARVAQLELEPRQCDREILPCVQTQVALPIKLAGYATVAVSEDALVFRHWRDPGIHLLVF